MRWIKTLLTVGSLVTVAALDCLSQTQPIPLRIDAGGENASVQLSPLDAESEAATAKFFRSPADQALMPFSLLLKSNASQPIVALTLIWTAATPDGPSVMHSSFEAVGGAFPGGVVGTFGPMGPPIAAQRITRSASGLPHSLAPGSSMLVAPGRFIYLDANGSGGGEVDWVSRAIELSVLVDAVVLADGQVLGPDQSGTLDALNARNAAIEALLTAVQTARQNGQDPIPVSQQLSEVSLRNQDEVARTEGRMARMLMHFPNWEKRLETMEKTPLVNYHR